jgi:two-component system sensor histidine kinase KdpD
MQISPKAPAWPAALIWAAGWGAMLLLDGRLDLANLALLLMLFSALASPWLPGWAGALASALAVAAFNWVFVPPRYSFDVDIRQHALLLATMLVVNWLLSALVLAQRRAAQRAEGHAAREQRLRLWGDTLRDADQPLTHAGALQHALAEAAGVPVALWLAEGDVMVGEIDAERRAGLQLCQRENRALGPGSGRHEEQPDLYLPLRGRGQALGAAVLQAMPRHDDALREHAQALCDQYGLALQRAQTQLQEQGAREQAKEQGVRNALLAAIAHDHRTPLATIMGAASSLADQGERMDAAQRQRLASSIVDEAARLARLTDNTLQLARLGSGPVALRCDWESAEDLVGAALHRVRRRDPARRVHARLEPGLPLLWCDAMLVSQMLDNLIDNALKYSPEGSPVELLARRAEAGVVLAVRDRGPGIAPAWRERVFQVFQRGADEALPQGTGVGLAVCRAIAEAHGGTLKLRHRGRGGSSFECTLPLREAPAVEADA